MFDWTNATAWSHAAKHAFSARGARQVDVKLRRPDIRMSYTVADNGVGSSANGSPQVSGGMSLVQTITAGVGGGCGWTFGMRSTIAELAMPISNPLGAIGPQLRPGVR
jgi:two-component sensor histidine kinase